MKRERGVSPLAVCQPVFLHEQKIFSPQSRQSRAGWVRHERVMRSKVPVCLHSEAFRTEFRRLVDSAQKKYGDHNSGSGSQGFVMVL
jgi:hypothetical protein